MLPSSSIRVPSTAKAAVLNVTLVAPSLDGFLSIWPFNTALPTVSTINASAGEPALANGAIVPLTTDPSFNISLIYGTAVSGGTANVILDVTGEAEHAEIQTRWKDRDGEPRIVSDPPLIIPVEEFGAGRAAGVVGDH